MQKVEITSYIFQLFSYIDDVRGEKPLKQLNQQHGDSHMNDATNTTLATTVNPFEGMTPEQINAALAANGLKVVPVKAKAVKEAAPVRTPEEILLEAANTVLRVNDEGHLEVIPVEERTIGSREAIMFDSLSLKARTTLERIAQANRPPVTGARRGRKPRIMALPVVL
jgi:hypothetical protein